MAQTNPKKQKPLNRRDLGLVILFIAIIVGLIILVSKNSNQPDYLTLNDFQSYVEQGQVTEVYIKPAGSGANEKLWDISGKYNVGGVSKSFYITVDDATANWVREQALKSDSMKIDIDKLSEFDWLSLIYILGTVIFVVIILFMFFKGANTSNKQAFDFAKSRARLNRQKTTTFKDVAGADEEKEEMQEVIDFLKNPRKYFEIGARVPKGILLVGSPGTGKTLIARAVAGEASVPFYSISGSDFVEMFVGVGASRVRDMFKTAKQTAPCIIFIDEIDAVGRQRGAGLGGGHDEREQTLNQLLVEMDGFGDNSGIIVMAATNRPDVLDPALLRPGRFDRQITMTIPDMNARVEILKVHARNKKISPKVHFDDIAKRTPGFTGADLENLLNEAALLAARENRREVKIYDIDEAIDRVLMGPAKRSRKYTPNEKKMISYHEAGHAILGMKLKSAEIVQKVTIVPRGQAGGYSMMTPEEEHFTQSKQQLLDQISGLLGGRVAEEIFIGEISTGAYQDIQRATAIARAMVAEYGMSKLGPIQYEKKEGSIFLGRDYMTDKNFSDQVALEIDHEVRNIINDCHKRATEVLEEHREIVTLVAEHLYEIETLTREDIYELVNTKKLDWWERKKAKLEAEKIAKEKENELQEIYQKQLKAMEEAKLAEKKDPNAEVVQTDNSEDLAVAASNEDKTETDKD